MYPSKYIRLEGELEEWFGHRTGTQAGTDGPGAATGPTLSRRSFLAPKKEKLRGLWRRPGRKNRLPAAESAATSPRTSHSAGVDDGRAAKAAETEAEAAAREQWLRRRRDAFGCSPLPAAFGFGFGFGQKSESVSVRRCRCGRRVAWLLLFLYFFLFLHFFPLYIFLFLQKFYFSKIYIFVFFFWIFLSYVCVCCCCFFFVFCNLIKIPGVCPKCDYESTEWFFLLLENIENWWVREAGERHGESARKRERTKWPDVPKTLVRESVCPCVRMSWPWIVRQNQPIRGCPCLCFCLFAYEYP